MREGKAQRQSQSVKNVCDSLTHTLLRIQPEKACAGREARFVQ